MKWICVQDRLPEIGRIVLATDGEDVCTLERRIRRTAVALHNMPETLKDSIDGYNSYWEWRSQIMDDTMDMKVTHWMRLSELPLPRGKRNE